MPRFWNVALLSAALTLPMAVAPVALRAAEDRHEAPKYEDKAHNDQHEWNSHEDKAYRIWVKDNHRKYRDFAKLKEEERQEYWAWRHNHSDAELKIVIR